jgi:hypothetical protein
LIGVERRIVAVAVLAWGLDPKQGSGVAAAHTITGSLLAAAGAVPQLGLRSWFASAILPAAAAAPVRMQGVLLIELLANCVVWIDTA